MSRMIRPTLALVALSAVAARGAAGQAGSQTAHDFVTVSDPVVALTNVTVIDGTGAAPHTN